MSNEVRVLVVDDSAVMRRCISEVFEKTDGFSLLGIARNGAQAIEMARKLKPDLITLDIEMPEVDGLHALPTLKRCCEARIIMVSSLTTAGSNATLTALRLGADDFIAKDHATMASNTDDIRRHLLNKSRALCPKAARPNPGTPPKPGAPAPSQSQPPAAAPRVYGPAPERLDLTRTTLIGIGSSTGGPPVLEKLLTGLPATLKTPIVIAQHMPLLFTKAMATRLDGLCPLNVVLAEHGMPILDHHVYIAPGGQHTSVRNQRGRLGLQVSSDPPDEPYKPSANVLFSSMAEHIGATALGVMFTGMGNDGLVGCRALHQRGGKLIAQDEKSCVVWGMPRAITEDGITDAIGTPDQITRALAKLGAQARQSPAA